MRYLPLLLLTGCAAAPFNRQMADAHVTYESIIVKTEVAANSNKLPLWDAGELQLIANLSRNELESAKQAEAAGDHATAQAKFTLAHGVLEKIEAYLAGVPHVRP